MKSQQGQHHTCAAELDITRAGDASPMAPRPQVRHAIDRFARFMDEGYPMNGASHSLPVRLSG